MELQQSFKASDLQEMCIDIETVSQYSYYQNAPDKQREVWCKIVENKYQDYSEDDAYKKFTPLYPEFGRIVCITISSTKKVGGKFYVKSFRKLDEKELLTNFWEFLDNIKHQITFVGHRIKTFDLPFIRVRMLANGIILPEALKSFGKKPWTMIHKDTWEMWKGGVFASSQAASLDAMCMTLGVESPKDDELKGSTINAHYWKIISGGSHDKMYKLFSDIQTYCEKDVRANVLCYLELKKLMGINY